MREGAGEEEANAAGISHNHGADLEQTQADRADLGTGQLGTGQTDGAQSLHQHIGQGRQEQAKLVRPPQVATGAIGEQAELTFLDAVLHLATSAVAALIEFLGRIAQRGDDEARIGALSVVFGLDDDAPQA